MRGSRFLLGLLTGISLAGILATTSPAAENCPPCLAFDRLDKQIRDSQLPKEEAKRLFTERTADLDTYLAKSGSPARDHAQWVFPLAGYDLTTAGAEAAKGYVTAGYDYFAGNRHGGHPSFDLFIHDRDQDCLDDRTGQPVTVVAMTGGIVVAAEPGWAARSPLRGGKYLWIYDPAGKQLVYYAHNRDLLVGVGDRVAPGTPIATVGRSGFNASKQRSPTHLHLTVLRIRNGRPEPENIHAQLAGAAPPE